MDLHLLQGWHLGMTEYFMELHQEMDFVKDAQGSPPPRKEPSSRLILGSVVLVAVELQAVVAPQAEVIPLAAVVAGSDRPGADAV